MTRPLAAVGGAMLTVVLAAAVASGLAGPVDAAPAPSATADVPISVVIPNLNPAPSPSQSSGGGGSGGGSGSGSSTPTPSPTSDPRPGHNEDGSPIPPSEPSEDAGRLKLDRDTYQIDDWMIATGTGYGPDEKVQFVLYPGAVVLGSAEADETGKVVARIRVPDDTRPGPHVVEGTGWTSDYVANDEMTVVAVAGAEAPWLWWVILVLGVLVAGLIALAIYFRDSIRGWFTPGATAVGSVP